MHYVQGIHVVKEHLGSAYPGHIPDLARAACILMTVSSLSSLQLPVQSAPLCTSSKIGVINRNACLWSEKRS